MKRKALNTVFYLLLCAATATVSILCLSYYETGFIARYFPLLCVLVTAFVCLYAAAGTLFLWRFQRCSWSDAAYRTMLGGAGLAAVLLSGFAILQRTGFLELVKDETRFEEYLRTSGRWMPFLYVLLQFLQVVVLPIPGFVSTIAGVALFGPFFACLYSLIGIIAGSFTAFFIGRKFGAKAVGWMVGVETMEKWQKRLKGKDNFILTAMFLLPVFPDDVLCFVAGLSSMSNAYFSVMIVCSRVLSVVCTCYFALWIPITEPWGGCRLDVNEHCSCRNLCSGL